MAGNGVSHRGIGHIEDEGAKLLQRIKKRKAKCSSGGLKKKGKMNS